MMNKFQVIALTYSIDFTCEFYLKLLQAVDHNLVSSNDETCQKLELPRFFDFVGKVCQPSKLDIFDFTLSYLAEFIIVY
ncbi:hypothetical protein BpHYR1_011668 [Brachionus plicatilis]|uniref:Uncharacterized protein n=1 Tax=Brachionus plicatilis TaxID=10195 RepID=A0A3M7RS69_BRAPC|nr:hypothetical protein BpHYR1_011668 [Brachionus plicatilis]